MRKYVKCIYILYEMPTVGRQNRQSAIQNYTVQFSDGTIQTTIPLIDDMIEHCGEIINELNDGVYDPYNMQEDIRAIADHLLVIIKNPAFPTKYEYNRLKNNISKLTKLPLNNVNTVSLKRFVISMRMRLIDIKIKIDAGKRLEHGDVNNLMDTLTLFIDSATTRIIMMRSASVRSHSKKIPSATATGRFNQTAKRGGKRTHKSKRITRRRKI